MNTIFARLTAALSKGDPDTPEVAEILTTIKREGNAAQIQAAVGAVNVVRISRGQVPDAASGGSSWYMKYLPWAMAALGVGGTALGATGNLDPNAIDFSKLPQWHVTNRWVVFGILAAVGAVVGTFHSVYQHRALVLPAFAKDNPKNMLVLTSYGFLGDLFYGLAAAVTLAWTALPSSVPEISGGQATDAGGTGNLLTWNLIVSAAVAAFAGAKAWSGWRGNIVAQKALAQTATLPAGSEELRQKILEARTIGEAAMLASGMKMTLVELARKSRGDLDTFVTGGGIDATRVSPALDAVFLQANETVAKLRTLPKNWTLTIERLPK